MSWCEMVNRSENQLIELKIAGRWRKIPIWASKLPFEVRPSPRFDHRAWKLWKPTLKLMAKVVKREQIKINWVRIHSHFNLRGDLPHAMGWFDPIEKSVFLCHFDGETMLHELGHAKSSGYHGDPWARATAKLYQKYLSGKEQKLALDNLGQYLSGRRAYYKIFGEKPPKYQDQKSLWWHLKPNGKPAMRVIR